MGGNVPIDVQQAIPRAPTFGRVVAKANVHGVNRFTPNHLWAHPGKPIICVPDPGAGGDPWAIKATVVDQNGTARCFGHLSKATSRIFHSLLTSEFRGSVFTLRMRVTSSLNQHGNYGHHTLHNGWIRYRFTINVDLDAWDNLTGPQKIRVNSLLRKADLALNKVDGTHVHDYEHVVA